jgi:hypothetical protein
VEDKHFFRVWTADAELLAQVSGKCIHEARRSNSKLPKVGDWVAVKLVPNEEKAVIPTRRSKGCNNLLGRGVGVKSNKPSETRMRRLQHGRGCNSTLWLTWLTHANSRSKVWLYVSLLPAQLRVLLLFSRAHRR